MAPIKVELGFQVKDITIEKKGDAKMFFLAIITIVFSKSISEQPDSLIKFVYHNETLCITTEDILSIDTFSNRLWTFHLSSQKSREFDSLFFDKGEIFFIVNGTWIKLQEHEIRNSHIPTGHYITTNLGKIEYYPGKIQIGYYKPPKKKKKNKLLRKLLYGFT